MAEYISKEAFKARIREQQKKCASPDEIAAFTVFSFLLQAVDEEPAADVQPVKRGEWGKRAYGRLQCSYCGKCEDVATDFCPNCGARMEGDQDNE